MHQNELVAAVLAGNIIVAGEYRHSKAETINWRDKQTGRAMSGVVLRHTIEMGSETVAVSERVPDGVKEGDIRWPWVKGQRVVLHLEELSRKLGLLSARGRLEALQANGDVPTSPGVAPGGGAKAEARR